MQTTTPSDIGPRALRVRQPARWRRIGLSLVGTSLVVAGIVLVALSGAVASHAQVAPVPVTSPVLLKLVQVPEPPNLGDLVQDKAMAVRLGKALFWDMQVGSDGATACASCHFQAGADSRIKNQINPGSDGVFEAHRPNASLSATDFPFHKLANAADAASPVLSDTDDVVGSQGVIDRAFQSPPGPGAADAAADRCQLLSDPVFSVGGTDVRRVTGRNAPSVINAVFNFRNFWDGRANDTFNGVNPFGSRDPNARVWKLVGNQVQPVSIAIPLASLASQATGPGLSPVEMSCDGRTWPFVGRKLLNLTPLGKQQVDSTDSVLSPLAAPGRGLKTSYADLIKQAFRPEYWSAQAPVQVGGTSFSQMEANFSLFWGLAIQTYEATLVSDDTPLDRYAAGDSSALTAQQQRGLDIFMHEGKCVECHSGPEFTSASVNHVSLERFERMHMANNGIAVYDNGFYNTGVRPAAEDVGVAGTDPFGNPLSEVGLCLQALQRGQVCSNHAASLVNGRVGEGIPAAPLLPPCPEGTPSSTATCDRINVLGAFKTPGLRNVELTGPYMHNGGLATLRQVVEFYNRGGDFGQVEIDHLDPNIVPLHLNPDKIDGLVAFMTGLTDERVRWQRAPFDHPQLCFPDGQLGGESAVMAGSTPGAAADAVLCMAAVGAGGSSRPLQPFLVPGPFEAPSLATPTATPTTTPTPSATASPTATATPARPVPTPIPTATPAPATAPVTSNPATAPASPRPSERIASATSSGGSATSGQPGYAAPPSTSPAPSTPAPVQQAPAPGQSPVPQRTRPSVSEPAPTTQSAAVDDARASNVVEWVWDGGAVTLDTAAEVGNVRLGTRLFALVATDQAGAVATTFDPPLVLTFHPTSDDLAALLADLSVPPVSAFDPDSGEFRSLPITWNADGTLVVSLDRLGPLGALEAVAAPAEPGIELAVAAEPAEFEITEPVAAEPAEFEIAEPTDTEAVVQDES